MSNYSALIATINANIKANNNHEITGAITNSVLNAMVNTLGAGYQFMGVATPTNPGSAQTPDYKCFYIATTPGTYTNLGGLVVADGEVAILKYDTSWTKEVTGAATADQLNQLGQKVDENDDILQGEIDGKRNLFNIAQGAWSSLSNLSVTTRNNSNYRISGELKNLDATAIKIIPDSDYPIEYAIFNKSGVFVDGRGSFSTDSIYYQGEIGTVRIDIMHEQEGSQYGAIIRPNEYANANLQITLDNGAIKGQLEDLARLRVVTFNIGRYSYGVSPFYLFQEQTAKIANYKEFLMSTKADILSLCEYGSTLEADNQVAGNTGTADTTLFNPLFPYEQHATERYATALKSKIQLLDGEQIYLTPDGYPNRRLCQKAYIFYKGRKICLLVVHLVPGRTDEIIAERREQMRLIMQLMAKEKYCIVAGDFNAETDSEYLILINNGLHLANGGYRAFDATYQCAALASDGTTVVYRTRDDYLTQPLDNIVTTSNIIIENSFVPDTAHALSSDHLPLIADLIIL